MGLSVQTCGAVILAGGASCRMGRSKALLKLENETLIARLARQLAAFDELIISSNSEEPGCAVSGRLVPDIYPGLGPLAGLHGALSAAEKPYLLCVSCDLPFFTGRRAAEMLAAFPKGARTLACAEPGGRIHPLCGIYATAALPVMERRLRQGQLRMRELLEELDWIRFPVQKGDIELMNVNTPEAYHEALAIYKRTGKGT